MSLCRHRQMAARSRARSHGSKVMWCWVYQSMCFTALLHLYKQKTQVFTIDVFWHQMQKVSQTLLLCFDPEMLPGTRPLCFVFIICNLYLLFCRRQSPSPKANGFQNLPWTPQNLQSGPKNGSKPARGALSPSPLPIAKFQRPFANSKGRPGIKAKCHAAQHAQGGCALDLGQKCDRLPTEIFFPFRLGWLIYPKERKKADPKPLSPGPQWESSLGISEPLICVAVLFCAAPTFGFWILDISIFAKALAIT